MLYLLLSILSSCLIFVVFKLLVKYKLQLLPVIVINYITASITGYILRQKDLTVNEIIHAEWFYISIVIGIMFILMFYTIGFSTQKAGITITSISTKMSVVIPMLFSIVYYHEKIYFLKIIGTLLALLSIFLASLKGKTRNQDIQNYIFPLLLFFGMGIVDSTVNPHCRFFPKIRKKPVHN
jgi:drug/metabolite transporter (DMT)-like permease